VANDRKEMHFLRIPGFVLGWVAVNDIANGFMIIPRICGDVIDFRVLVRVWRPVGSVKPKFCRDTVVRHLHYRDSSNDRMFVRVGNAVPDF